MRQWKGRIEVSWGDIRDAVAVATAVRDCDAVIRIIGRDEIHIAADGKFTLGPSR